MQHDPPRDPPVNWLPTPGEPFMLMLRLYRPKAGGAEPRRGRRQASFRSSPR